MDDIFTEQGSVCVNINNVSSEDLGQYSGKLVL